MLTARDHFSYILIANANQEEEKDLLLFKNDGFIVGASQKVSEKLELDLKTSSVALKSISRSYNRLVETITKVKENERDMTRHESTIVSSPVKLFKKQKTVYERENEYDNTHLDFLNSKRYTFNAADSRRFSYYIKHDRIQGFDFQIAELSKGHEVSYESDENLSSMFEDIEEFEKSTDAKKKSYMNKVTKETLGKEDLN